MKQTIEIPEGHELIQDGNTFTIVKKENKYPTSFQDINDRNYVIVSNGKVSKISDGARLDTFTSKKRAKAMLALGQLIELWSATVDKEKDLSVSYLSIESKDDGNIDVGLWFNSYEQKDWFENQHKELIETVKQGI